jgi:hypothetical protein
LCTKTNRKMSFPRIPLIKTAGRKNKSAARAFIIKKSSQSQARLWAGVYIFPAERGVPRGRALYDARAAFCVKTTRNRLKTARIESVFERASRAHTRATNIFAGERAINADIPACARTARGSGAESRSGIRRSRPIGASGQTYVARQFPVRYFRIDSQPLFAAVDERGYSARSLPTLARPPSSALVHPSRPILPLAHASVTETRAEGTDTSGAEGAE